MEGVWDDILQQTNTFFADLKCLGSRFTHEKSQILFSIELKRLLQLVTE